MSDTGSDFHGGSKKYNVFVVTIFTANFLLNRMFNSFELFSEKKTYENKFDSFVMPYKNTFISIVELRKVIQHPL